MGPEGRCNYKIRRNAPIYHPPPEMLPRPMTKRCIHLLINFRGICQHAFHFIPAKSSILSSVCGLPGRGSCQDVHTLLRGNQCVSDLSVSKVTFTFFNGVKLFSGMKGGGDNLVPRRDPGNEVGEVIAGKTV